MMALEKRSGRLNIITFAVRKLKGLDLVFEDKENLIMSLSRCKIASGRYNSFSVSNGFFPRCVSA